MFKQNFNEFLTESKLQYNVINYNIENYEILKYMWSKWVTFNTV
jgi:hypothetical protein